MDTSIMAVNAEDARQIFDEVLLQAPSMREAFLKKRYGDRTEVVREVQALLRFHALEDDPLEAGCKLDSSVAEEIVESSMTDKRPEVEGYDNFTEIARGGQGTVYRARQNSTGQLVAIKMLRSDWLGKTTAHRLEQETQLLAGLQHPNIVTVVDHPRSADGVRCLVTRFIRGEPIDRFAKQLRDQKWETLAGIIERTCDAIDAAHRQGVIHRDLKPSNILVDQNQEPFVLDFGLAKELTGDTRSSPGQTETGTFLGSVAWASPEQIDASVGPISPRTDIYQLGVVFYHLLSNGCFPYCVDGGHLQVFNEILRTSPVPLATDVIPAEQLSQINRVLVKAMQKRPEDRFTNASEFGKALSTSLQSPQAQNAVSEKHTKRSINGYELMAIGLAVILAIVGWQASGFTPLANPGPLQNTTSDEQANGPKPSELANDSPGHTEPSLLSIEFAEQRAPHLPEGWRGDDGVIVANGRLTVPSNTRTPLSAKTERFDVSGDWLLSIEHEIVGNGVLQVVLRDNAEASIRLTIHRGRIEVQKSQIEKTKTVGRRQLSIRRGGDRLIANLEGGRPLYLDASSLGHLSQLEIAMSNSGSGGGDVGVHAVRLRQIDGSDANK